MMQKEERYSNKAGTGGENKFSKPGTHKPIYPSILIDFDRQQFIPRKLNEESSQDKIINWLMEKLDNEEKFSDKNSKIEIEGRLGEFIVQKSEQTVELLARLSRSNYIILNDLEEKLPSRRFETNIDGKKFESMISYISKMKKVLKNRRGRGTFDRSMDKTCFFEWWERERDKSYGGDNNCKQIFHDLISIDIVFSPNANAETKLPQNLEGLRVSYKLGEDKWEAILKKKKNQSNLDLIHNELHFRISACEETPLKQEPRSFLEDYYDHISVMRIKFRKTFRYQFMELSATRTLQIDSGMNEYQTMMECFSLGAESVPALTKFVSDLYLKYYNNFRNEVEVEIVDVDFLQKEKKELFKIHSHLRKFLRNIEVLHSTKDFVNYYNEIDRFFLNKLPTQQESLFPLIGNYIKNESENNYYKGAFPVKKNKRE